MLELLWDKLFGRRKTALRKLAVVTEAIDMLDQTHEAGGALFMCHHLRDASIRLGHQNLIRGLTSELKRFVMKGPNGSVPRWWSGDPYCRYEERRDILVAFQARMQHRYDRCIKLWSW